MIIISIISINTRSINIILNISYYMSPGSDSGGSCCRCAAPFALMATGATGCWLRLWATCAALHGAPQKCTSRCI